MTHVVGEPWKQTIPQTADFTRSITNTEEIPMTDHHTPTVEELLAQPARDDEADTEAIEPLESIALHVAEMSRVAQMFAEVYQPAQSDRWEIEKLTDQLSSARSEIESARMDASLMQERLDEVLALCKPSTSKLANAIRGVLVPPVPEPAPQVIEPPAGVERLEQPADDASVTEWQAYAETRGFQVTPGMNRSQIRTMLGIEQPVEPAVTEGPES